jgi:hypothetical protein
MLERTLHFLQVNKSNIQPCFREKITIYKRQILSILSSQRRKPVQAPGLQTFQQSGGQASSSNISQQHQTSQGLQQHDSHTDRKPQASLPSWLYEQRGTDHCICTFTLYSLSLYLFRRFILLLLISLTITIKRYLMVCKVMHMNCK